MFSGSVFLFSFQSCSGCPVLADMVSRTKFRVGGFLEFRGLYFPLEYIPSSEEDTKTSSVVILTFIYVSFKEYLVSYEFVDILMVQHGLSLI
jgi:hypothetical protein